MTFKRLLFFLLLLLAGAAAWRLLRSGDTAPDTVTVEAGLFELWTPFSGSLDSVRRESVASPISQPAALLLLAPEGAAVSKGDVVAVLDVSPLESSLATLERDLTLAEAELRSLLEAELPLQLAALEEELREAREALQREERVRPRWEELAEQGLISPGELAERSERAQRLRETAESRERRLTLTREVLHPARIQQAEARRDSALRQARLLRGQVAAAEIRAGLDGIVLHLPLHIGGEYRTVREGDMLFRNQEFLRVADMSHLVVTCLVPEARISLAPAGARALVYPDAFPDLALEATVMSAGATAETVPGRSPHEKFFRVTLLLEDSDPRLRTGMNTRVLIRSRLEPDSVLLPRPLVSWQGGTPRVQVAGARGAVWRDLDLDGGNGEVFRVRDGLRAGERVIVPEQP